jgi:hypothetical protein
VKVNEDSTVVSGRSEVEWFITNGGDSGIKGWADQGVVDAF